MNNKKSGLKSDVKRKFFTGAIEVLLGVGILTYALVTGNGLYLYAGGLFAGSGALTLGLAGARAFIDKKVAEREAKAEAKRNEKTAENTREQVAENTKAAEQSQAKEQQEPNKEQEPQQQNPEAQQAPETQDSRDDGMEM